ncbi:VQ motif-containing protein 11-like [Hibiscus syriacus]|uniref:VQ motif-containing protein 11-like n=1 Tax=Hibiscus syriacus TaxID=106335 RepID=UPI001922E07E|nr:VQ motif-containing protein 11-like [Hibiscus syriacus]
MASSSKTTMACTDPTTTFVQADPSTFRTIVQHLTGATTKKPVFKLHERRQALNKLEINLSNGKNDSLSAGKRGSLVSPVSTLDFFPLLSPPSNAKRTRFTVEEEEEEKGTGFYLHHQSRGEPELLHLFPLHAPRENIQ